MIAPTTPSGRDTSPMLPPAGMGLHMPSLCPVEGCVVPPAGFMPGHRDRAEERKCRQLFIVGGGRANGLAPASGQDRANDLSQYLADGLPRPVGVEVVVCVYEASDLHAPSIRMESENDVQPETPKSSSDVRHDC